MIRITIVQIHFFVNDLLIIFSAICEKCGRGNPSNWLRISRLTNVHVGCFACDTSFSFSFPIYDRLIETVRDIWQYSPEDIKTFKEKLQTYQEK